MDNQNNLKSFLTLSYGQLETLNHEAKKNQFLLSTKKLQSKYHKYLESEASIKAVTICFSDIEGRLHMLDYDKKFFLSSADNLTFDGSSVRGFSSQSESDLRLTLDWGSIMWLPADIFGAGKVIMFADVKNRDDSQHGSDFRGILKKYCEKLATDDLTINVSAEIEGFLVEGVSAEQDFDGQVGFKLISTGGYYHSLPQDRLRQFIDRCAEVQRALAFENEKDHPEVAPSQFEMNFSYSHVLRACDQILVYKLICRQVANLMGLTATFLPKPVMGINGSGMHTNISFSKSGKNIFFDKSGRDSLSTAAWDVIGKILNHAPEICLVLNPSVNAYRRLDPHYEAPNQIKVSPIDRGSMIRIPFGNEKSARIEIRSVAPDVNPYLCLFTLIKTGLEGKKLKKDTQKRDRVRFLPDSLSDAIRLYKSSDFIEKIMGPEAKDKYISFKEEAEGRSPKYLGKKVKKSEVIYHHEITNQALWNEF